jgi:hypothetical protein
MFIAKLGRAVFDPYHNASTHHHGIGRRLVMYDRWLSVLWHVVCGLRVMGRDPDQGSKFSL